MLHRNFFILHTCIIIAAINTLNFHAYAGNVTASPAPVDPGGDIPIECEDTVDFQAQSDNDDGSVTFDQGACSFGAATDTDFNSTGGTADVFVTFDEDTLGQDCPCWLYVNHSDPLGTTCVTNKVVYFKVIVPDVTISTASLTADGTDNAMVNNTLGTLIAANQCTWSIAVQVTPLDAVPFVKCQLVQDIQGTTTKVFRSPPPGETGMKQNIPSMALDGTSSVQDPEGGFILMDSGDEPQQIDSAGTYSSFNFNDTFNDYIQYQIQNNYSPWETLSKGTWTLTGTATATLSGSTYTAGGGTTSTVTANFSDSSDDPVTTSADKNFYEY